MGWIASFQGLEKVGVPPLLAIAALAAVFFVFRRNSPDTGSA